MNRLRRDSQNDIGLSIIPLRGFARLGFCNPAFGGVRKTTMELASPDFTGIAYPRLRNPATERGVLKLTMDLASPDFVGIAKSSQFWSRNGGI